MSRTRSLARCTVERTLRSTRRSSWRRSVSVAKAPPAPMPAFSAAASTGRPMRPICSCRSSTPPGAARSTWTASASAPRPARSCAAAWIASSSAATTRSKPWSANWRASSRPMPLDAPVTTASGRDLGVASMRRGFPAPRPRLAVRRRSSAPRRRELLEHPPGAEQRSAEGAPVDLDVVARARVHRQVALDRVPLVVLLDELVELVEAELVGAAAPALREGRVVAAALLAQQAIGVLDAAALAGDAAVDVGHALHPARAVARLEVVLDRALGLAGAARERPADALALVEVAADEPLDGGASRILRHPRRL